MPDATDDELKIVSWYCGLPADTSRLTILAGPRDWADEGEAVMMSPAVSRMKHASLVALTMVLS
jgi:hypothetical protein